MNIRFPSGCKVPHSSHTCHRISAINQPMAHVVAADVAAIKQHWIPQLIILNIKQIPYLLCFFLYIASLATTTTIIMVVFLIIIIIIINIKTCPL
jgi:hypothetical protein